MAQGPLGSVVHHLRWLTAASGTRGGPITGLAKLVTATTQAAFAFVAATAAGAGGIAPSVAALAEGALKSMFVTKCKVGTALLLVLGGLVAGAGALARQALADKPAGAKEPDRPRPAVKLADEPKPAEAKQARTDRYGDSLPPSALMRLGTVRFRHGETIGHLAFSPDGKLLASVGLNLEANANPNDICLWDQGTGRLLRRFGGHAAKEGRQFLAFAFSPNGRVLATQRSPGTIQIWETATGRELREITKGGLTIEGEGRHEGLIGAGFAFSPDGRVLAARGPDKAVHLWEVTTGKDLRRFPAEPEDYGPLAFSPSGKLLVIAAKDVIRLCNTATGKEVARLRGHEGGAGTPNFSPDGKTFSALARTPGQLYQLTLYTWELATARLLRHFDLPLQPVFACAVSPDAKRIVAVDYGNGGLAQLDLATGKKIRHFASFEANTFAVTFSPDGKTVAAGGINKVIQFWDTQTGKPVHPFAGHKGILRSMSLSPDGKLLASVASDQAIWLWDLSTGKPVPAFASPRASFSSVAFSPDGQTLAAASGDPFLRLLKAPTGKELRRLAACRDGEQVVAFSPDGRLLAAGDKDGMIRLWETATGKALRRIASPSKDAHYRGVLCLFFSPDGKLLASCGWGDTVYLWKVASGKPWRALRGHQHWIRSVSFSRDGKALATSCGDKSIRLWEVATGEERCRLHGHEDRVSSLAFCPDGRHLASGSDDRTVRIWDLSTAKETGRFTGHLNVVGQLAFSADGRRLISGSWDTTMLVWDMDSLKEHGGPERGNLMPAELEALWTDLAGADASKAYRAIGALTASPGQSIPFLQNHLRPCRRADPEQVARLVADLDSKRFAAREQAMRELEKLAELAEPAMRKALRDQPALEVRRRIEGLLDKLDGPVTSPETLRTLRAMEVLEHAGTSEAKAVLQTLAGGAREARATQEAKASLDRLARRPAAAP